MGYVNRVMANEQDSMSVWYYKLVFPRVCRRENVRGVFPCIYQKRLDYVQGCRVYVLVLLQMGKVYVKDV